MLDRNVATDIIKGCMERFKIDLVRLAGSKARDEDLSKIDDAVVVLYVGTSLTPEQAKLAISVILYVYHLGRSAGSPDSLTQAGTDILRRLTDVKIKGV